MLSADNSAAMPQMQAKFHIGQLVHHHLFDYRGVIVDVDPIFQGSEEWYEQVARSRPPKDRPWYRVLVHEGNHETYVAERNLEPDESADPIDHPQLSEFFSDFRNGCYRPLKRAN
jgi:heat shock protein HspQ